MKNVNRRKLIAAALRASAVASGLFSSLYATEPANVWVEPKGKYDPKQQVFVDADGKPILTIPGANADEKTTYCSTSRSTDKCGRCDDDTVYQACD